MNNLRQMLCVLALVAFLSSIPAVCSYPQTQLFSIEGTRIEWCAAAPDVAIAQIHVKLKLTNKSDHNLILSRLLIPFLDIDISGPSGEKVNNWREYELSYAEVGAAPSTEGFEVVSPGDSALREFIVTFPVSRDPSHPAHSIPAQGSFEVSATLSTWPFWKDQARAKRTKHAWQRYGSLVVEQVRIEKLKVDVHIPAPESGQIGLPTCGQHDAGKGKAAD